MQVIHRFTNKVAYACLLEHGPTEARAAESCIHPYLQAHSNSIATRHTPISPSEPQPALLTPPPQENASSKNTTPKPCLSSHCRTRGRYAAVASAMQPIQTSKLQPALWHLFIRPPQSRQPLHRPGISPAHPGGAGGGVGYGAAAAHLRQGAPGCSFDLGLTMP